MAFDLFIGALLALIFINAGLVYAILTAIILVLLCFPIMIPIRVPDQQKILNQIVALKIESKSEQLLGVFDDKPIHAFIMIKNPADGVSTKYVYDGIIRYNRSGQITRPPKENEVYTSTSLIYKKEVSE